MSVSPSLQPPAAPSKARVFAKRLISTLGLWGFVVVAILWGRSEPFFLLFGGLGVVAVLEFASMDVTIARPWRVGFIAVSILWLVGTFAICQVIGHGWNPNIDLAFASLVVMLAFLPAFFRPLEGKATLWAIFYVIAGFFYLPWMWSFMTRILFLPQAEGSKVHGIPYLIFVVAATKFTDCGAYAMGSLIGKHKMIPHVSPGKTWEGMIGAFLGALAVGMGVHYAYAGKMPLLPVNHAVILCIILAAVCIVGDLAESVVKRCLGIKDSGKMLPGIGGSLDLIDSLLWTGPVFYFYVRYISSHGA